jgi:hypothetical protein
MLPVVVKAPLATETVYEADSLSLGGAMNTVLPSKYIESELTLRLWSVVARVTLPVPACTVAEKLNERAVLLGTLFCPCGGSSHVPVGFVAADGM